MPIKIRFNNISFLIIGILIGIVFSYLYLSQKNTNSDGETNKLLLNNQIFNNNLTCKELGSKFIEEERKNPGYDNEFAYAEDVIYSIKLNSCLIKYYIRHKEGNIENVFYAIRNLSTDLDIYIWEYRYDYSLDIFRQKKEDITGNKKDYDKLVGELFN